MINRKNIFFLLLMAMFWFSCTEEEGFNYQLTDDQFVNILADLHLSESATQHLSVSLRDSMSIVYMEQVLEIHQVPTEIFEPEYSALKRDPQKLVLIYDKVIKQLNDIKLKKKKGENPAGQGAKQRTKKK